MKNYCLVINNSPLFFKSLDSVKSWFIKCGVKKRLELGDEEYLDLDNGNQPGECRFDQL